MPYCPGESIQMALVLLGLFLLLGGIISGTSLLPPSLGTPSHCPKALTPLQVPLTPRF